MAISANNIDSDDRRESRWGMSSSYGEQSSEESAGE